jgi:YD repeat-containing protein
MDNRLYVVVLACALFGSASRADDEAGDGDGDPPPPPPPAQMLPTVFVRAQPDDYWGESLTLSMAMAAMASAGSAGTPAPPPPPPSKEPPREPKECDTSEKPVVLKTGNKILPERDFSTQHSAGLFLERFHNANANDRTGMFGPGWFSNFDLSLLFTFFDGPSCGPTPGRAVPCLTATTPSAMIYHVSRVLPDGSVQSYTTEGNDSTWRQVTAGGATEAITRNADGTWTLVTARRTRETYNAFGYITSIRNDQGFGLNFSYASNRLQTVTHTNGSTVHFEWNGNLVSAVIDPLGNRYLYSYTGGNLTSVTFPGPIASTRSYHYEGPGTPPKYTGISDDGVRYTQNDYYADGRTFHSALAGGIEQDTFSYGTNSDGTKYTQMTNALGLSVKYTYQALNGQDRLVSVDRSAAIGCPAAASKYGYEAGGRLLYEDDFNGRRICYQYNGFNSEVARVEGLANTASCTTLLSSGTALPADARKTSHQIHPDWQLVVKRATPLKLTTWVYNGQPDPFTSNVVANCITPDAALPANTGLPSATKPLAVVCRQVEQATTDTNGSKGLAPTIDTATPSRIWTFTYNQWGQLLTATDPRGNRTVYAYYPTTSFSGTDPQAGHYWGDLMSITNAKGTVTRLRSYDKAGRVLEVQDGNNASTTYSYWPRGWLKSIARGIVPSLTAGEITKLDYWPNGLLKQITQPNNSALTYGYDAVHRLTTVSDASGNSITYATTYDTANQQVLRVESVRDATGTLQQNIRKAHDALGRLRSVSGATQ